MKIDTGPQNWPARQGPAEPRGEASRTRPSRRRTALRGGVPSSIDEAEQLIEHDWTQAPIYESVENIELATGRTLYNILENFSYFN